MAGLEVTTDPRGASMGGVADSVVLDLLPVAVVVCAPDGAVVRFNRRAAEVCGCDHLLGASHRDHLTSLLRPDGPPIAITETPLARALRTGRPVQDELQIVRAGGERRHVLVDVTPIHDAAGAVVAGVAVLHDVTERRATEQALRELQARRLADAEAERGRLAALFDHAPALISVLVGPDHVYERVNDRHAELIGGRPTTGRSVREVLPEVVDQGYVELLDEVYRTGQPFTAADARLRFQGPDDRDARIRYADFVFQPLRDADGRTSGILALGVDTTERRRAQRKLAELTVESERLRRMYAAILASVPDLVCVWDTEERCAWANRAMLDLWGRDLEEVVGRTLLELARDPEQAVLHARELAHVRRTGAPVRCEVPYGQGEATRYFDYHFVPVLDEAGELEAVVGAAHDVTDRKRLQHQLRERATALEAADRAKDEFIAVLAHELRNPLAPIRSGVQALELAPDDAAMVARVSAVMDRQLRHLVHLVDDLLDTARISSGKLRLQRRRVPVQDVISTAVEAVRGRIDAAGHTLTVSVPDVEIPVDGDLTRLAQVVANLLLNSARYTDPGGRIEVRAEATADEVVITVQDDGIGIPRHALGAIFERFSQVHRDDERATNGLGLGLALVRGLVDLHGGTVVADSEGPGRGSTFTVRLPRPEPTPMAAPARAQRPSMPPMRILIADDNEDAAEAMSLMLILLGHEVHLAHDGLQALAAAERFRPHVVLMDVGMPHMSGLEATRRLRDTPWGADIAVIALTGWGHDTDRARTAAAGCDVHLVKPVDARTLLAALAACAERRPRAGGGRGSS